MFNLKEKIKSLSELLKSKNKINEEDLPSEDLKLLSQSMIKDAPEYAIKHKIMESNIEILNTHLKCESEEKRDLVKLLKSLDLSKIELNDENEDLIFDNIFDNHKESKGYYYQGFCKDLDDGFTSDAFTDLKCFPKVYVKSGKTKSNPSISNPNHATYITCMIAYPFANGYAIYKVEEYL